MVNWYRLHPINTIADLNKIRTWSNGFEHIRDAEMIAYIVERSTMIGCRDLIPERWIDDL